MNVFLHTMVRWRIDQDQMFLLQYVKEVNFGCIRLAFLLGYPYATGMKNRPPLAKRTIAELRAEAAEYRRMAATARTAEGMASLFRIADRFDALADQREREARGRDR
jgi:hypothetical protein